MTSLTVDMTRVDSALDLAGRIRAIPETARLRGVLFNQLDDALGRALTLDATTIAHLLGPSKRSYKLYPAREFARVCAIAGALVDKDPHEGMRRLTRGTASFFSTTWFGKVFHRFLRPDPFVALQWVSLSRDYIANFGQFRVEKRGPAHALVHIYDEYVWIESVQRGGCEGMLDACGVKGTVTADLDAPFRGRLNVKWELA